MAGRPAHQTNLDGGVKAASSYVIKQDEEAEERRLKAPPSEFVTTLPPGYESIRRVQQGKVYEIVWSGCDSAKAGGVRALPKTAPPNHRGVSDPEAVAIFRRALKEHGRAFAPLFSLDPGEVEALDKRGERVPLSFGAALGLVAVRRPKTSKKSTPFAWYKPRTMANAQ